VLGDVFGVAEHAELDVHTWDVAAVRLNACVKFWLRLIGDWPTDPRSVVVPLTSNFS